MHILKYKNTHNCPIIYVDNLCTSREYLDHFAYLRFSFNIYIIKTTLKIELFLFKISDENNLKESDSKPIWLNGLKPKRFVHP